MQTTDNNHSHPRYPHRIRRLDITAPDQVWVGDITSIRLGKRFIYLVVILDACIRAVHGWALSRSLEPSLTVEALHMALAKATPFIFHSDQGVQYASFAHTSRLLEAGVRISMSDKASPTQNRIVGHFMRMLKEEHVDYADYQNFDDAFQQLKH